MISRTPPPRLDLRILSEQHARNTKDAAAAAAAAARHDSCGKTVMAISHVRPKGGIYDRPRQSEAGCESAREREREASRVTIP